MFFYLSKLLMFLITPVLWIVFCLLFSLFSKKRKRKRIFLITALIILLFFSNGFILDEFMRAWEMPATKYENLKKYDYGIVLSGLATYDTYYERLDFKQSADRLFQAVELYKRKYIRKIFITGGSGSILNDDFQESKHLKEYLIRIGIPEKDILIEVNSRNTNENAVETAKILLQKNKNAGFLLITSAFHMRRALKCYDKVGIHADPYCTNRYAGPRKYVFDHMFIPDIGTLTLWTLLIHEIVGYLVYSIIGYV